MLGTFSDVRVDHLVKRRVVMQQGNLIDSMEAEIANLLPDLVVVGTEGQEQGMQGPALRPQNWSRGTPETQLGDNVAMALLKRAPLMPLLIVKPESVGPLRGSPSSSLKSQDDVKSRSSLRLLMEAGNTQLPMLSWIFQRLTPSRAQLIFAVSLNQLSTLVMFLIPSFT